MTNGNGRDEEATDPGIEPNRRFPRLLEEGASNDEMVKAINGLAVELQMNREALQEFGKALGSLETAVRDGMAKRRR